MAEKGDWIWRTTLASKYDDYLIEDSDLFPLKEAVFEGVNVFVPKEAEKHLTNRYGDWKKLPPVEEQVPVHHLFADADRPWTKDFSLD